MRVVAGIYRSRIIKEVPSAKTRPTTDKNKETLFNILGQYFDGGMMLDLFAGSGALGIEALSRGMASVDFVDTMPEAVKTVEENLISLGLQDRARTHKTDVFAYLKSCKKQYNLIIADPPYALDKYQELLDAIVYGHLVAENGIIVFEADSKTIMPSGCEEFKKYREKVSGNTKFAFYGMEESL